MPIRGSFARYLRRRVGDEDLLVRKTMDEGLEAYERSIKKFTPVDTGELRENTNKSKARKRVLRGGLKGEIIADTDYARFVEYGAGPHVILPKLRDKLRYISRTGPAFSEGVLHPGFVGQFMFLLGTSDFKYLKLRPIMEKNMRLYMRERGAFRIR